MKLGLCGSVNNNFENVLGGNKMKFEVKKSKNDQFYFNIVANNHEIIATSEMYTRKENALHTINLIANELYSGIIGYTVDGDGIHMEIKKGDNIILSKNEYEELKKASIFLESLKAHGVDNWVGYGDAYDDFKEITEVEY